jgi:hypothetical protein
MKTKTAKPGMARDWKAVVSTGRRQTTVAAVFVNDITGTVAVKSRAGALKGHILDAFKKVAPPEAVTVYSARDLPEDVSRQRNGWRRLWPRTSSR